MKLSDRIDENAERCYDLFVMNCICKRCLRDIKKINHVVGGIYG